MTFFVHEALYRTEPVMARLAATHVTICGTGAIGANLAETLCRTGAARLRVIDMDRIEERNLSTQPWFRSDVGSHKVKVLSNSLFRAVGVSVEAHAVELTEANVRKLLQATDLVVDAFDNSRSRGVVTEACRTSGTPCLHLGLAGGYAEVLWNEAYRVPADAAGDVCDYPLARSLVLLAVAVGAEVVLQYLATGLCQAYTLTLADLQVRPYH